MVSKSPPSNAPACGINYLSRARVDSIGIYRDRCDRRGFSTNSRRRRKRNGAGRVSPPAHSLINPTCITKPRSQSSSLLFSPDAPRWSLPGQGERLKFARYVWRVLAERGGRLSLGGRYGNRALYIMEYRHPPETGLPAVALCNATVSLFPLETGTAH